MSENQGRASLLKPVGIGVGSAVAVLALIIGGTALTGSNNPEPSNSPQASASESASPSASASPLKSCSVADLAADPRLASLSAYVLNTGTNEVLFDRQGDLPKSTASVMKAVTATVALATLGPNYRVDTRVYSDPAKPGVVYLVGGGDPTLSRLSAAQQSVYKNAPKLASLAIAVNAKLSNVAITKIIVVDDLFAGPNWDSTWEDSERKEGYMSQVSALQTDGDRKDPKSETSWRSQRPALNTGGYFKTALGSTATAARVTAGTLPSNAVELAKVTSAPISSWITHMLQVSDNTQAEALARLVSLDLGFDGSGASIDAAFKKALAALEFDTTGMYFRDGSGLSDDNAVSPIFMAKLMQMLNTATGDLAGVKAGMPVAGESGSLAARFSGENVDARGHVIAKTGWIKKGYTLSGIINAKDGSTLTFAVYALGSVKPEAKDAIDNLVTGFYRCGNELSNE